MDLEDAATYPVFRRMSPTAVATSAVLHGAVVLAALAAAWPRLPTRATERAVEITVDLTAAHPAEPASPVPQDKAAAEALRLDPEPARLQDPAEPPVRLEKALPPLEAPPPAVTSREVAPVATPARTAPAHQRPPLAHPRPRQSAALAAASQQRTAQAASDARQRKAREDYLWQIIQKLSQYKVRQRSREASEQGVVVTRLTLARDGHVLDVALARSSGFPDLDRGVMDTIREASPFAPLPADIPEAPYTLVVPIGYVHQP